MALPTGYSDGNRLTTLDQEIKELISALTGRQGSIQRAPNPGDSSTAPNQASDENEQGVRIITLAGTNLGATMRGEKDEKPSSNAGPQGLAQPEQDDFMTYVNSNFQSLNNSIMLGGSYETNDPGVHLDITDYAKQAEPSGHQKKARRTKGGDDESDQP